MQGPDNKKILICSILNNAVKTVGETNLIPSLNSDRKSLKEERGFPIVVSYRQNFAGHDPLNNRKTVYSIHRECFYSDQHKDVGLTEIGIFSSF